MSTILGLNNLLDNATSVWASSSPEAHPVEDGFDYLTTDYWQPEGTAPWDIYVEMGSDTMADYVGLVGEPGAVLEVACIPPGSVDYTVLASDIPTASVAMSPFTAATAQKWRLRFTGIAAPKVAHISLGRRSTLPVKMQPFTEPKRARVDKVETSITQSGHFAGRSVVRNGLAINLDLALLEPSWVEDNWLAWRNHMETNGPFFLLWDAIGRPNDAAFAWVRDLTKLGGPRQGHAKYLELKLDLEGMV